MFRWIVILLAALAALSLLLGFFPTLLVATFTLFGMVIPWGIVVALALLIAFAKATA